MVRRCHRVGRRCVRSVPGPRGLASRRSLRRLRRQMLTTYLALRAEYGDVVRVAQWPYPLFLLSHPDAVQHVLRDHASNYRKGTLFRPIATLQGQGLLTSEGDLWRQQRRLAQPVFRPPQMDHFAGLMTEEIQALVDHWRQIARQGKALNIVGWMHRLAFRMMGRALLGIEPGSLEPVGRRLEALGRQLFPYLSAAARRTSTLPLRIPLWRVMRVRHAVAAYHDLAQQLIAARRQRMGGAASVPGDLLALLITACDASPDSEIAAQQLRDEVITMIGAAVETSAQVLSWMCYILARYPAVAQRVRHEVLAVAGARSPVAADLPCLVYSRMVLDEVMRLYPPSAILPRQANAADTISGYPIPRNAVLLLSQYVTHRHPDFWSAPECFNPERFSPEQVAARHRFAYFPFGAGPRTCIGKPFALMEMQLVLATIVQTFQLTLVDDRPLQPHLTTTLQPQGGLWLNARPYG